MATPHKPIDEIMADAVEISSSAEREEFLDAACGTNVELRQELEHLIHVHFSLGHLMERPAAAVLAEQASASEIMKSHTPNAELGVTEGGTLGDFQVVREVGRGGMGVVYEARQISLNRQVALKVLPFSAVLDQRQLERFKTEAQAAAGLHHGNIVPVFHIGHERAVHYYAMQYIEGQDVSDLIGQLQQIRRLDTSDVPATNVAASNLASGLATGQFEPLDQATAQVPSTGDNAADTLSVHPDSKAVTDTQTLAALSTQDATNKPGFFRTIAGLGIQAAEALEFAHQNGILHRDIKPSNLMLDAGGKLWIADFGLAHIEGAAGLTMTGDIVGTLRYMSPEQATASNNVVDCRSDVYSLGVTLYEMLSLTPIFPEADRHELLLKRQQEEPVPLRQVNHAIPADLETIIHKAIAREPDERYDTAKDLADDLQRYLNGEPIHARRPSVVMRLCKWSQRNRGLAALLIAAAFIGGIVAASVVVVIRDRDGNEVATVPAPEGSMAEGSIGGADTSLRGFAAPQDQFTNGLRGLIPYPESLPGVGRWQVVSKGPRSFLQHNWKFTWSPDSRFLALGDGDDVRVYSVPDFQLVRLYSGHTGSVVPVDWSPDGKTIASTSIDNTVRLWDAETGVPGPVLVGHRDRVDAVAWHPNCRMLATGGRDATVRLWNIDGTPTHILKEHTGLVTDVAWSRDGERLASLGYHGTLRLWSASGEPQKVISLRGRHQRTVEWSPDGQRLLVARISTPDAVRIWKADGSGGKNLKTSEALIGSAAWSPDGAQVAVASWDNKVHLFESDGTVGPTLEGHDGDVFFVEWSPDGSWLASGGGDRSIRLWKTDGTPGPVLKGLRVVADIAWHPNGHRFGVSVQDHSTRVYDASGVVERISNGLGGDFDWSADGKQIVSVGSFRSIQLWNVNEETTGECKFGMDMSYKGIWGYHPLLISLAETREPLRIVNRSGNQTSEDGAAGECDGVADYLRDCGFRKIVFRGDTAFSQTQHLDRWTNRGVTFYFGYKAMKNVEQMAETLESSAWRELKRPQRQPVKTQPRAKGHPVKENIVIDREYNNLILQREDVAEFIYKPIACDRSYRMIVLRKQIDEMKGQKLLLAKEHYLFYITNDHSSTPEEVVFQCNDRCEQENLIEQLKNGPRSLKAPVDNLYSNWAYMLMSSLAWTLKAWLALSLPETGRWKATRRKEKRRLLKMEFRTFVNDMIRIPCQVARTGRRIIFRLLNGNQMQPVFWRLVNVLQL